jgi:hypothetical protein
MPRRLGASLEFHIRHAQDILALEELGDERPENVSEEDWNKLDEVLALASRQATALLTDIRDRASHLLADRVIVTSKSTPRSTRHTWDSWLEFKMRGVRSRPIGCIGAKIATETVGGDVLVVYMRATGGAEREARVTKALIERGVAIERDVSAVADRTLAPLLVKELSPEDDADALVAKAVEAIERLAPHVALCAD